jgi:hypothetical protein
MEVVESERRLLPEPAALIRRGEVAAPADVLGEPGNRFSNQC